MVRKCSHKCRANKSGRKNRYRKISTNEKAWFAYNFFHSTIRGTRQPSWKLFKKDGAAKAAKLGVIVGSPSILFVILFTNLGCVEEARIK